MDDSRQEWLKLREKKRLQKTAERAPYYRGLIQSEVASKQLTNHPAWNWFLQLLAGSKQKTEAELASFEAQMRLSGDFSHQALAGSQATRLVYSERLRTLEEVMSLPSRILDEAGNAREKLKELNLAESQGKSSGPEAS